MAAESRISIPSMVRGRLKALDRIPIERFNRAYMIPALHEAGMALAAHGQDFTFDASMLTKEELPACPVATIVKLIGNKWKLLIIRNLPGRTQRFNEMRRNIPGISQKVLTDNLRELEHDELIVRKVYAEVPPRSNIHSAKWERR